MQLTRICSSLNGGIVSEVLGLDSVHLLYPRVRRPLIARSKNARSPAMEVRASRPQIHFRKFRSSVRLRNYKASSGVSYSEITRGMYQCMLNQPVLIRL